MQRALRRAGIAALIGVSAIGVSACGSSAPAASTAPAHLLAQALGPAAGKLRSGDLSLTIDANLNGLRSLGGRPLSLVLSGPFTTTSTGSPEFDFDATLTVSGQTVPLGLVLAGHALYVEFAGTYYAIPSSTTGGLLGGSATGAPSAGMLGSLGIDPRAWLVDPTMLGSATVGGVATEHITAQVDVAKFLTDLSKLSSRLGSTGASGVLNGADLSEAASAVSSARVDLYVGKSDHVVRELKLALAFAVPPAARSSLDGVSGGSLTFDAQITNLGASETITPPASSQPLSSLLSGAGGLSSLL